METNKERSEEKETLHSYRKGKEWEKGIGRLEVVHRASKERKGDRAHAQ